MKIKIKLLGNKSNNKIPTVRMLINNVEFYCGTVEPTQEFVFYFEPKENNTLCIEHYNKYNEDTIVDANGNIVEDLSVELKSIHIDDVEIMETVLFSMPYYVEWPDNIVSDYHQKGETPPEYINNNLYFGFNGTYKFAFSDNVVVEYYKQFWLDEVQAHQNQTFIDGDNEIFERMGEKVAVNQDADFTIHDLKRLVINNES